jgi:hypothetical protein
MLTRIDRVLISARDAGATAARLAELLDAAIERTDTIEVLNAHRFTLRIGDSVVEILEPNGAGPVADHLASGRGGPFAAGVATANIHAVRRRLAEHGVVTTAIGPDQHWACGSRLGIPGLGIVISPGEPARRPVGLLSNIYEVTHLTATPAAATARLAELFALDARSFVPIESERYGYRGVLTLFDPDRLHRVESIHPYDAGKTMARFFTRFGPCLYMCYAETDRLPELRARLKRLAPAAWTGSDDDDNGLFIHPKATGGLMIGVSRTSYAWTWSGHPERVTA